MVSHMNFHAKHFVFTSTQSKMYKKLKIYLLHAHDISKIYFSM